MATVAERKIGAILGATVADAAGVPIHWMYDAKKLDNLLGSKEEIEFHNPPGNPFYRIETGCNSCYGDQAFVLLESLVACKGFNEEDLVERTFKMFGPGSEYDNPEIDNYVAKSGVKLTLPINAPWKQSSVKHFLKNVKEGNLVKGSDSDEQMDGVTRLAPIVAMYAGKQEMLDHVEEACRVMQNSDFVVTCVLAAARLLEHYILNGPDAGALPTVISALSDPHRENPQELDKAMAGLLHKVQEARGVPHREAVPKHFRKD